MFSTLFELINLEISKGTSVKSVSIVNAISDAIEKKIIVRDSKLPSVNEAVKGLSIARTTIVKAYKELINRGIIESRPRYGYFVISENTKRKVKVIMLLHNLNPFQEQLYNAFEKSVGDYASVEVFFHHCNTAVFKSLILDKLNNYGLFVITPYSNPDIAKIIAEIPPEKVLIIDQLAELEGYSYICQNFYESILNAMPNINNNLKKYNQGVLLFPKEIEFSIKIKNAFIKYFEMQHIPLKVFDRFKNLKKGSFYIVLSENDLVKLVKEAKNQGLKLGKDIGILSYNDMPIKEIIADGITVISTNFTEIGRLAGEFVKNRTPISKIVETNIIERNSL
ncbi:GntR family transcriptional regulator [uncultured Lutibacter sp.]|uniref:GntR family transcriptional regulator n=1 Tax=uncultured Lutibacter sp. TaxID=437739 RepID=UPI0026111C62|nr:GntR family transcriptional regulator [uncultured Lutibacter sp.]